MASRKTEIQTLERRIEEFARSLGMTGEVTTVSIDRAWGSRMHGKTGRFRDPSWHNAAVFNGLNALRRLVESYEQFKAFSMQTLLKDVVLAQQDFHEKVAAAVDRDKDDRQFELRKQKRAERKRLREVA
jgi:hypothetical protein